MLGESLVEKHVQNRVANGEYLNKQTMWALRTLDLINMRERGSSSCNATKQGVSFTQGMWTARFVGCAVDKSGNKNSSEQSIQNLVYDECLQ